MRALVSLSVWRLRSVHFHIAAGKVTVTTPFQRARCLWNDDTHSKQHEPCRMSVTETCSCSSVSRAVRSAECQLIQTTPILITMLCS